MTQFKQHTTQVDSECETNRSEKSAKVQAKNSEEKWLENNVSKNGLDNKQKAFSDDYQSFLNFLDDFDEKQKAYSGKKKKGYTELPGFLFDDGKLKVIGPNGEETHAFCDEKTIANYGNSEEECERLTKNSHLSSYQVLRLHPDVTQEEIRRAYRKISLLIHPDKTQHPKAKEAFLVATKAYDELQKPEMKTRYDLVIDEAKKRVLQDIAKKNKILAKKNEPLLPTDANAIQNELLDMCEKLLEDLKEKTEYAEKCKKANERYEKMAEEKLIEEEKNEKDRRKKWEEERHVRVECWREFKEDVQAKKIKLAGFVPLTHHRESRKPGDKSITSSKPKGIDESYKLNWR